jgi:hypothetical protein
LSRHRLYHGQDGKSADPAERAANTAYIAGTKRCLIFHALLRIGHAEPKAAYNIVRMSKNIPAGFVERGKHMSAADQYRRNASECIAITAFFVDPQQRAAVLALAEAWTRLAEQAEKNEQIVLLTPERPPQSGEEAPLSDAPERR